MRKTLALLMLVSCGCASSHDWPQFRGPDGQGHSNAEGLALTWSEEENVAWKVEVPGRGWSSPVVAEHRVWLTSASDDGRSLRALCFDRESGDLVHDVEVFQPREAEPKHSQNSYASPTPVIDGDRLYVHFGPQGTACLDRKGAILWRTTEFSYLTPPDAAGRVQLVSVGADHLASRRERMHAPERGRPLNPEP